MSLVVRLASLTEKMWYTDICLSTRGWTLQELVAPHELYFFDEAWNYRGRKWTHAAQISDITGIRIGILRGNTDAMWQASAVEKMSWAAHRVTTRIEDRAYCLLGLFDVNMPLLYGEEHKAFRRLQEEIIRSTSDLSIFAWKDPRPPPSEPGARVLCGILAESPAAFSGCGSFIRNAVTNPNEFSISNIGIKIRGQIVSQRRSANHSFCYVLSINGKSGSGKPLGIRLRKVGPDLFLREDPWTLLESDMPLGPNAPVERYLLTKWPTSILNNSMFVDVHTMIRRVRQTVLQIKLPPEITIYGAWPWPRFDDEDQLFFTAGDSQEDFGSLRLTTRFTIELGGRDRTVVLESMFYAVGWSSLGSRRLQCTLIDYQDSASKVNELQFGISHWDNDGTTVLDQLAYHKFPKQCAVRSKLPRTKCTAIVSFKPQLVDDLSICANKFWSIEFSCEIYKNDDLPPVSLEQGDWVLEFDDIHD